METSQFPVFVGRADVLAALRERLERERVVALNAPPGFGKTALAREYINRFADQYQYVLWLSGTTYASLLASLLLQLQHISLAMPHVQARPPLIQALRNWLVAQENYLLVLDNAEDPSIVQALFPARPAGHLLLLADQQVAAQQPGFLSLGPLAPEEGAQLLLISAGLLAADATIDYRDEARSPAALELARTLQGHPLALKMAGACIKATGYTLQDYLQRYHSLHETARMRQKDPLETAWRLSHTQIASEHPGAVHLLCKCVLFTPDDLPLELFALEPETGARFPEAGQVLSSELSDLLQPLFTYAFCETGQAPRTFNLSRCSQQVLRQIVSQDEQISQAGETLRSLLQSLPSLTGEKLEKCLRYLPHVQRLLLFSEQWSDRFHAERAQLFSWASGVLAEFGIYQDAAWLLERSLGNWQHLLGEEHPTTMTTQHNLAALYEKQGRYAEAEELFRRVLSLREKLFGAEDPDTVATLNNLAQVYIANGKKQEAVEIYQRAVPLCEQVLESNHPVTGSILYNLGVLYLEQEKFAEAELLLEQARNIWDQILGADKLETARIRQKLVAAYAGLEKWKLAETLCRRVQRTYERYLGEEHPQTIQCLEQLALLQIQRENFTAAQQTAQRIVKIRKRQVKGPDTLDTAIALGGLAGIFMGQSNFVEAQELLQRVMTISEVSPQLEMPVAVTNLVALALTYIAEEKQEEAVSLLKQAYTLWEQSLGSEHPHVITLRQYYEEAIASLHDTKQRY